MANTLRGKKRDLRLKYELLELLGHIDYVHVSTDWNGTTASVFLNWAVYDNYEPTDEDVKQFVHEVTDALTLAGYEHTLLDDGNVVCVLAKPSGIDLCWTNDIWELRSWGSFEKDGRLGGCSVARNRETDQWTWQAGWHQLGTNSRKGFADTEYLAKLQAERAISDLLES